MGVEWSLDKAVTCSTPGFRLTNKQTDYVGIYLLFLQNCRQQFTVKALVPVTLTLWLAPIAAEKMTSTGNTEMWESEASRI